MQGILGSLAGLWWLIPIIVVVLFMIFGGFRLFLRLFGIIMVPDNSIGLVTKKFVLTGKNRVLPAGKVMALEGEAGYQARTLEPGIHYFMWPWQYSVRLEEFTTIPQGHVGIVESIDGATLEPGRILGRSVKCDNFQDAEGFLRNGGQRGPQMGVIPPGTYRINTVLFKITLDKQTVVESGQIGVVEALDGAPLPAGRVIATNVIPATFQNPQAFIDNGGQRGPQMAVLTAGQYMINPLMFNVRTVDVIDVPDGKIGVVATKEGMSLGKDDVAGPEVPGHDMYQNPQAFVDKGGFKGVQEQVLPPGRYFINPDFATVQLVDMTVVPIAHVGVVISYVGAPGQDVTGDTFKHGNLVKKGEKGVWVEPLDPGKFPINPYTHKVELVPTANVVLNWATGKTESHRLDERLSTIKVRSSDGFTFNLDVSQIIHVPRNDAPRVIARFGNMLNLVTQVLEPIIGNYFRNAAQEHDVISFLKERTGRQDQARKKILEALQEYNVGAVDTLIGDIVPPEELMRTLTDRKIAEQETVTYKTQMQAEAVRQELEQARALANTQARVVDSERKVKMAEYDAKANIAEAEGKAKAKTVNAAADAEVTRVTGEAEAGKIQAIGSAEADVTRLKIDSMKSDNYAAVEIAHVFAEAAKNGANLVPQIVVSGPGDGSNGNGLLNAVMAKMLVQQTDAK